MCKIGPVFQVALFIETVAFDDRGMAFGMQALRGGPRSHRDKRPQTPMRQLKIISFTMLGDGTGIGAILHHSLQGD